MSLSASRFLMAVFSLTAVTSFAAFAQTQASCAFTVFQLHSNADWAYGVNDYGTVVGSAAFSYPNPPEKGFIRYSNGSVSFFLAPNAAATRFTWRNDNGASIGVYSTQTASNIGKGFMLNGSTFTSIVHPTAVWGTTLTGLNKYNSIVGWYLDANENPHGFKRYSDGSFRTLQYGAGAIDTIPEGINDFGTMVGWYNHTHGFIFHNNAWATLDYPKAGGTELKGVSNSGVIVGINHSTQQGISFLYANGAFKVINVPNSFLTNVSGISPGGLIVGMINLNGTQAGWRGFTATCH